MRGIDQEQVCGVIVRAFDPGEFDMFLKFRFDFRREAEVADGPFRKVVSAVLDRFISEGWEFELIAAVAEKKPMKAEVQEVYRKYAQALVGKARRGSVQKAVAEAYARFGLAPGVVVHEAGAAAPAAPEPATDAGLEKIVKKYLAFLDPVLLRDGLLRAEGAVCRVEVNDRDGLMGTGFLVGPDALLTNHHVLEPVLNGRSAPGAVHFRFDYKRLANGRTADGVLASLHATDWRLDDCPCTPGEARGAPGDEPPTHDQLDYALVRLDRPVGDEPVAPGGPKRGWLRVPAAAPALTPKMPILILQHPNRAPLQVALDTEGVLGVNGNGTRVRYATNTAGGSSGSPCCDVHWNLVALHHYGDPAYKHPRYNQGVPIAAVRARVEKQGRGGALGDDPA